MLAGEGEACGDWRKGLCEGEGVAVGVADESDVGISVTWCVAGASFSCSGGSAGVDGI